jgi:hypothetical protein
MSPLTAKADEWDKATTITFNKPVEIPGMVLTPGTYVLKLADLAGDRNVVQIFNADESHLYETVLAISAYRLEPTDKTIVTFEERPKGAPEAIDTWFYPGDNYGQEFVYSSKNETGVAGSAPQQAASVTQKPPETGLERKSQSTIPEAKKPSVPQAEGPAAMPPAVPSGPAQFAQNNAPPKPAAPPASIAPAPSKQHAPKELPKTASPVPDLILIGLLSLATSGGIHVFSKRTV